MKKRKSFHQAKRNGNSGLWLITGILIGLFIGGLTFLKKKEVNPVTNAPISTTSSINPSKIEAHSLSHKKNHHTHPASETSSSAEKTEPQYDFYTVLPQMKANSLSSTEGQKTPATTPPSSATTPQKPLADAEASMLSHNTAAETKASSTNTHPESEKNAKSTTEASKAPKEEEKEKNYQVVSEFFTDYSKADAAKAALVLSGIDQAKIEKVNKAGKTEYYLTLGVYPNLSEAKKIAQATPGNWKVSNAIYS